MVDDNATTNIYSRVYSHVVKDFAEATMTGLDLLPLTPQARQILAILHDAAKWVNRSDLAKLAGKKALNKWDIVLLAKLSESGFIQSRQVPHHGPIGYEWQYRAIQVEAREDKA